jgi:hypothetical protein
MWRFLKIWIKSYIFHILHYNLGLNLDSFLLTQPTFCKCLFNFHNFYCCRFIWKLPRLFKHVILKFPTLFDLVTSFKISIPVSQRVNKNNNCRLWSNSSKTIARKMLFFWEHVRGIRSKINLKNQWLFICSNTIILCRIFNGAEFITCVYKYSEGIFWGAKFITLLHKTEGIFWGAKLITLLHKTEGILKETPK